jgi:hypothetical protein
VLRLSRFTALSAILVITAFATPADARRAPKSSGKRAASSKSAPRANAGSGAKGAPAHKPAGADPRPAQARKACLAGNVERGIQILAEIIVENGDANAVYNQARCYQQNGRSEEAVARFREYLRTAAELAPADRAQVERYISELDADIEAKARRAAALAASSAKAPDAATNAAAPSAAAPPAPPARPSPPAILEMPPPVASDAAGELAQGATPAEPSGPSNLRHNVAIAAASVGLASVAAGAYFSWRTAQISHDIENNRGPIDFAELDRTMARGRLNAGLQWAGYGVGAAALATAAALLYWDGAPANAGGESARLPGGGQKQAGARFIIVPTVQPTAAGGVATGALAQSTF